MKRRRVGETECGKFDFIFDEKYAQSCSRVISATSPQPSPQLRGGEGEP